MAKRRTTWRWRKPPGAYRIGEKPPADPHQEELRLSLYLPGFVLDWAEELARHAGVDTVQAYCTALLRSAIEAERNTRSLHDSESRRGTLEGLDAIASDPEYLAEWTASAPHREAAEGPDDAPPRTIPLQPAIMTTTPAAEVVFRHAGQSADDDPSAFLPALRRGEPVPISGATELLRALETLESECRDATTLDRRLAYALHRLAFESQILHTDAHPGVFDEWAVDTIRAVQEAVERVLSGQDIRFADPGAGVAR